MEIYEYVTKTWAYIQGQLDFPLSERIKIHFSDSRTVITFCGLLTRGGEFGNVIDPLAFYSYDSNYHCKKCIMRMFKEKVRKQFLLVPLARPK